jgi:AraC-like DNA-binding protein
MQMSATLLRGTDYSVADICMRVGLSSVGSFTTSFSKAYGVTPTQYRSSFPSAATLARIPLCVLKVYGRPANSTIGEDAR